MADDDASRQIAEKGGRSLLALLLMLSLAPGPSANPPRTKGIITAEDYPLRAVDQGEEGTSAFEALIAPDGHVDKCTIIASSGYQDLDEATCRIVSTRARFSPSQDAEGKGRYGTYRSVINWSLGNLVGGHLDPELELQINQAPTGVKLPLVITLDYVSMPNGVSTDCKLDNRSADAPAVLADLACKSILAQPPEIIRNSSGQPVEASNSITVSFSLGR